MSTTALVPLSPALTALLAFAGWTFLLVVGVFLYRGLRFLGGTPINHWPRGAGATGDAAFIRRVADAHANCLENLPLFAVIVLVAAASGRLPMVDALAPWVVVARVGQSLVHVSGTSGPQVLVRASCWAAQLVLFGVMGTRLVTG